MRKNYQSLLKRLTAVLLVAMLVPMTVSAQKFVTTSVDDASRIRYNFYEDESTGEIYALVGKDDYNTNGLLEEIKILKKVLMNPGAPMEEYAEVRGVEEGAFEGVSKLKRVVFEGHDYEASLNLPYYRYEIGAKAFKDCTTLAYVDIREAQSIGDEAFMGCTQLDNLDVSGVIDYIGEHCFAGCTKLSKFMYYNDNNITIGKGCFENCTSLKMVLFPDKLEEIPDEAFKGCKLLGKEDNIKFPSALKRIGSHAFEGCGLKILNMTTLDNYQDGTAYVSGCLYIKEIGDYAFYACQELKLKKDGIIYLSGKIGEHAFDGCSQLDKVAVSCSEIGKEAFINCNLLESVDFGYTKIIGERAFYELPKLETISFSLFGLEIIGREAFFRCKKLKGDLNFQYTLKGIEYAAFQDCQSITEVSLPSNCTFIADEWGNGGHQFYGCTQLKKVKLPYDLKVLPSGIFEDSGLEEIEWPTELTTIMQGAFHGCNNLSIVDLSGTKVETIGSDAFQACKNLAELNLGTTVKVIDDNCFAECSSLKKVTVPESCEKIGNNAFAAYYTGITSSSKVPMQLEFLYLRGTNLKTIPYNLCSADENLKYVELPPNLETIEESAFAGCVKLTEGVCFPASLRSIGYDAFANNNAKKYWSLSTDPQPFTEDLISSSAWFKCPFYNVNSKTEQYYIFPDAVLYVPKGMKNKYLSVEGWRLFESLGGGIIEMGDDDLGPVEPKPEPEAYNLIESHEDGYIKVIYNTEGGDGYDEEGKLVLVSTVEEGIPATFWAMDVDDAEADPEGFAAFQAWLSTHFSGIVLRVGGMTKDGKGKLVIDFESLGLHCINVWFATSKNPKTYPNKKYPATNGVVEIPFTKKKPTTVLIYPSVEDEMAEGDEARALARAEGDDDTPVEGKLIIRSLKVVETDDTGIETITTIIDNNAPVFDLTGRRVNENNLVPGIYVRHGQKMIVK